MALVSVITPVHNSANFMAGAVASVIAQTMSDLELILIDDASTDTSLEIAERLAATDRRIKVIHRRENQGAAAARNAGLDVATGKFVAFLDSDDLWLPHKLARQIRHLEETSAKFGFTAYRRETPDGADLGTVPARDCVSRARLLKYPTIGCLTAMYDREFFPHARFVDLRLQQDYAMWLSLLKRVEFAYGLNEVLSVYRVRGDSISANKLKAAQTNWSVYRDVEGLNRLQAAWYFCHYAIYSVARRL